MDFGKQYSVYFGNQKFLIILFFAVRHDSSKIFGISKTEFFRNIVSMAFKYLGVSAQVLNR
jgi:hypothetical protein